MNEHLEQIFTKLGVENRAAVAALAVRTWGVGEDHDDPIGTGPSRRPA